MKKVDTSLKWFNDEARRIRKSAFYHAVIVDGELRSRMDVATRAQLDKLELKRAEYLREKRWVLPNQSTVIV